MAVKDVAGEWVYHVREFLGHNFESGLTYIKT